MKAIILAGGTGGRLYPASLAVNKQLMPLYNKPMVYYPLCTLMLAGIREILVITTPRDRAAFEHLLGDGTQWGISIEYAVQPSPGGIAQAFLVGESFVDGGACALILGDNFYYGHGLPDVLRRAARRGAGSTVLAYRVDDPEAYGVVEFDASGRVIGLQEKPTVARSPWAVTGLYFYDDNVVEWAKTLRPSPRGELEITDLNRCYLDIGALHVEKLGRGFAWLDTGSHGAMLQAAQFVETIERRQGQMIACPEEIALRHGWITADALGRMAEPLSCNPYRRYLMALLEDVG